MKHILCNKQLVLSVMVFLCMGRTTAGAQAPVESSMSSGCDCAVSSSACDCSTGSSKCDCAVCSSESTCDGSHKKAWEFGVGLNGLQMTRFNVTGFRVNPQGGYNIDTDKRDWFFGGHVYVARELNRFFTWTFRGCSITVQTLYTTDVRHDGSAWQDWACSGVWENISIPAASIRFCG